MKIAVIGKGGREHALVKALKESPSAPEMYCFPGSDAINRLATPIPARDLPSLIDWMVSNKMDLWRLPGRKAIWSRMKAWRNACSRAGIPCWGPVKESAQLEASKEFAKDFPAPPPHPYRAGARSGQHWRKPGNSSETTILPC